MLVGWSSLRAERREHLAWRNLNSFFLSLALELIGRSPLEGQSFVVHWWRSIEWSAKCRVEMSPILINSSTNNAPASSSFHQKKLSQNDLESTLEAANEDPHTEIAREERKATGRSVAIVIFLSLMCLALYHVIQRKTTILAGVSCTTWTASGLR